MNASVTASPGPIEWLGQIQGPLESVGGKAASLDRLARLGFLVPPGFCLTTSAFAAHIAAICKVAPLGAALAALPDETARATVVSLVADTPPPQLICEALKTALAGLTSAGERSLAVRSSALGEDGKTASFVGLHDTELGLAADDVEAAVRRCWSSLWSPAALAYRRRRSLPLDGAAMAVVVQALVPADVAAVVFTRHPVTGQDDRLVINAVRGLGEPMVAGTATPDTVVVDKGTGEIREFTRGDAGERLVATDGGVTRVADPASGPALAEPVLRELVSLSLEVERAIAGPVDIEAAFARDRWYLLQARPITT